MGGLAVLLAQAERLDPGPGEELHAAGGTLRCVDGHRRTADPRPTLQKPADKKFKNDNGYPVAIFEPGKKSQTVQVLHYNLDVRPRPVLARVYVIS